MNWKLVSETRNACLRACTIGAAFTILIVFLQSIFGAFTNVILSLWVWVGILILPLFLCIWVSVSQNRYPSKLISTILHMTLVIGTWAYLIMLFFTKLSERIATNGNLSIIDYLQQSYYWLIPIEMILITGYIAVFYGKEFSSNPNEHTIHDLATEKAIFNQKTGNVFKKECFELIANNNLPGLFQKLKSELTRINSNDIKYVVLLEGQYNEVNQQKNLNLIKPEVAKIELNRIALGAISIAEDCGRI